MSIRHSFAATSIPILLTIGPAAALDPNIRITQYGHTAWRLQDGAFDSAPNAITQTADGYLWIGTGSGLLRFDGVHFTSWVPPNGKTLANSAVYSLRGSSDGTLWIGTGAGLLSWKGDTLHDNIRGRINSILEDHKGRIWATRSRVPDSSGGLCQIVGERPGCVGGDDRMRLPYAGTVVEDQNGTLWIGSSNQLMEWKEGSFEPYLRKELQPFEGEAGVESIAAAADGSVWVAIPIKGIGLHRWIDGYVRKVALAEIATQYINTVFTDRDGVLWMGTTNAGIYRIYGSRVDHFRSEDGLSSNAVTAFYEDREGNIWVATTKGLDCFRDRRVITFSTSEGLSADIAMSVVATQDGKVWIGNRGALDALERGKVSSIPIAGRRVTSLLEDHANRLWVGVDNTLAIYDHGTFQKVTRRDGNPLGIVEAMTEDREQNLWASVTTGHRLFRIRNGRVQEEFTEGQIPRSSRLATDPTGGVWLGFSNGNLGHYRNGVLKIIPIPSSGFAVAGLSVDPDGSVWAATRTGIIHWKNGESKPLGSRNGLPCDAFLSSIRDNQATLWIYSKCGLIGIPDSELNRWWQQPNTRIQFQFLDVFDGAMPGFTTFQPTASKSPDGRLWFVNDAVLQMVDPGALRGDRTIPPPVYIQGLRADRKNYAIGGPRSLPPRSRDIEIGYTALSFAIPQRVRFRYRLDERDSEWQDAGARREAFYSDLAPGQYHFHVTASNSYGVWNKQGASLSFSVAPAYYQTIWFRGLMGGAVLGMIAGLYRFRLYQVRREFNAHLEGSVNERLRVARELHDTLLQSFHASLVQMQAARNLFSRQSEEAFQKLDSAIKMTAGAIVEGRDAIQQLRSQPADQSDLAQLLTVAGQELAQSHETTSGPVIWRVLVEGARRDLQPLLQDEIFRITRELLRNAFQHAHAKQIEAEIRYERRMLRVHVRDNGKGIDPEILQEGGRAGHWGFAGMRERAQQIGARLDFWSERGVGTEVQLTVAASIAYQTPHKRWRLPLPIKNGGVS